MSSVAILARLGRDTLAALGRPWSWFWFQKSLTTPLELARIGLGTALFYHYAMATPYHLAFWGDAGWMPRDIALSYLVNSWMPSIFFYFTAPWQWYSFHALFLFC